MIVFSDNSGGFKLKRAVNWWNIITKIAKDKSTWDHLEPAEIIELVQRIAEAKKKIKDFDKHIIIQLSPALKRLCLLMTPGDIYLIHSNLTLYKRQFNVT